MSSAAEWLVGAINRRGYVLIVDTKGVLRYHPAKIDKALLSLIEKHATKMKYWLITDAVTSE